MAARMKAPAVKGGTLTILPSVPPFRCHRQAINLFSFFGRAAWRLIPLSRFAHIPERKGQLNNERILVPSIPQRRKEIGSMEECGKEEEFNGWYFLPSCQPYLLLSLFLFQTHRHL